MTCPRCRRDIPDDAAFCCYCGRVIQRKAPARAHQRGNGTGTAWRRGKTWTSVVTVSFTHDADGMPHQKRLTKGGFKTKNEALEYCPILKTGRPAGEKRVPTLDEYWRVYAEGELKKLSPSKQTAYKIAWSKLGSIAFRPVNILTVADLRRAVTNMAPTFYPARDMKVVLGHLYDLAGADGYVNNNLPDYIILPELHEKERTPFTQDEQAALWRLYDAGDRRAALPLIMIYTGMMPGEMQSLKTDMIHADAQQITGVGMKTKVRKESPVYLPDAIIPVILDEAAASTSAQGYVWPHSQDKFYADYYAALQAAGCRRLEPYCCRHTTATAIAITENIAPRTIQKVMRWSSTRMLDRYAHPTDNDAIAAVNAIRRDPSL